MNLVKIRFPRFALNFLLVALLATLLIALAALQYRWIGQTSDADRERLRRSATLAAENLSRDFDRELTRAYLYLQIDPISFETRKWDDFRRRYDLWATRAVYPKMVRRVFITERDGRAGEGGGEIRLSVYNEATGEFENAEWLPQLTRVRSEIETDLNATEEKPGADRKSPRAELLAAGVPALVIPITAVNLPDLNNLLSDAGQNKRVPPLAVKVRRVGYAIVLLDNDYIVKELLPSLVARYFNFSETGDERYGVIVASRDESPRIIYQSNSIREEAQPPREPDLESSLFAIRINELENLLPAARPKINSSQGKGGNNNSNVSVSVIAAAPQTFGATDAAIKNAAFGASSGNWRLLAFHRNGSLEAAIESARRRNLLVSFCILLLLAASGALLVVLLNRERLLAGRQKDFVASVSHELRTPLAVIRATSENIADGIVTDKTRFKEYGSLIADEERRLSAMVEQMLEFAGGAQAGSSNHYDLRRESFVEIIEAALNDYRTELDKNDFDVRLEIETNLPEILADRDALRRAFGNLIANAVKYGKAAANQKPCLLEIKACAIRERSLKQIEINFGDNGAGIERKDLSHIFELFYRGGLAIEKQIKGSGIGLSLVKQIVEAHGGTIKVASAPGKGSVFTIRLPVPAPDETISG